MIREFVPGAGYAPVAEADLRFASADPDPRLRQLRMESLEALSAAAPIAIDSAMLKAPAFSASAAGRPLRILYSREQI